MTKYSDWQGQKIQDYNYWTEVSFVFGIPGLFIL